MRVVRKKLSDLSSDEIQQIEHFLENNYCTVFHEMKFNKIIEEIFKTEFSYYIAYSNDGRLIALCPSHSIKDGLLTMNYSNPAMYEVPYGGWVYDRNETSLLELMNQMKLPFNEALTYWSFPQIDSNNYIQVNKKIRFQTAIIDLTLSIDDIRYKYVSRNTRHNINRASRKGIEIEELNPNNFDIFTTLCNSLKDSVGLKTHPSDYYKKVFNYYYAKNSTSAFVSILNGKYISSIMTIGNKKMMHAWVAGRVKNLPKHLCQNHFLLWETIKWAKKSGSRYYDLCIVEPERLPNIANFKLGFSREMVPFYCITRRNLLYRLLSRVRRIIR